jgi:hypothetical protein
VLVRTLPVLFGFALAAHCFAGEQPDLGLFLRFDSPPSASFVTTLQKELAEVLPIFHLHFVTDSVAPDATYSRILFVSFHGSCTVSPNRSSLRDAGTLTLGETAASAGAILPFSEIDCDRLRAFLDTADTIETGRESRLGRATGRVLAHELYHVLLQTSEHTKTGIGKAVHSPAALLSRSLRFEQSELDFISSHYSDAAQSWPIRRSASEPPGLRAHPDPEP